MAGFPNQWMDELLSRNDIVSVVSEYVALKEKGHNLWGLCPFHGEKTPSFSVSPDKQLYYCFGCHAGGGIVQFVMEMEKLSFYDAVKMLAGRANLPLPEEVDDTALRKERAFKDRLYDVCREAALYFHNNLKSPEGAAAKEYLEKRGVEDKGIVAFGLGFSLASWDALTKHLTALGYSAAELVASGLAQQKGDRVYDTFRGRVMFPIIGVYSRVNGFGARAMGDEMPKYLNSNETPIFNKRANLYGLNLMKGKQIDSIVIVEGYMDVVSLHLHGVSNAVASLGTALTKQQARLIKRYSPNVYIAYDGDSAGQTAMVRGLDILAEEGLNIRVIQFPQGLDPDDFIRAEGQAGFEALKQAAVSLNSFKLKQLSLKYDLLNADAREAFALEGTAFISTLSPVEMERQVGELARLTGFSVDAIKLQCQEHSTTQHAPRNRLTNYRNNKAKEITDISPQRLSIERLLLKIITIDDSYAAKAIEENIFLLEDHRIAVAELEKAAKAKTSLHLLLNNSLTASQAQCVVVAMELPEPLDTAQKWKEAVQALKRMDIVEEIENLTEQCTDETISQQLKLEYFNRIRELNDKLDKIASDTI